MRGPPRPTPSHPPRPLLPCPPMMKPPLITPSPSSSPPPSPSTPNPPGSTDPSPHPPHPRCKPSTTKSKPPSSTASSLEPPPGQKIDFCPSPFTQRQPLVHDSTSNSKTNPPRRLHHPTRHLRRPTSTGNPSAPSSTAARMKTPGTTPTPAEASPSRTPRWPAPCNSTPSTAATGSSTSAAKISWHETTPPLHRPRLHHRPHHPPTSGKRTQPILTPGRTPPPAKKTWKPSPSTKLHPRRPRPHPRHPLRPFLQRQRHHRPHLRRHLPQMMQKPGPRDGNGPVLANEPPPTYHHRGVISSDAQRRPASRTPGHVVFYFGRLLETRPFNTFAASNDLPHWTK